MENHWNFVKSFTVVLHALCSKWSHLTQPTEETLCQSKQNTLLNPQTSDENKETKSENKAEYGGACLIPALGEQRHKD